MTKLSYLDYPEDTGTGHPGPRVKIIWTFAPDGTWTETERIPQPTRTHEEIRMDTHHGLDLDEAPAGTATEAQKDTIAKWRLHGGNGGPFDLSGIGNGQVGLGLQGWGGVAPVESARRAGLAQPPAIR